MNKPANQHKSQMAVERLPIDSLSFDPANARKHPDRNLEAIKSSLRRFGQQKPIVIDSSNVVRAGNGTMAAAKALGWTEIDAVRSDLPIGELTAFAIADNRTAELAEWDEEILAGVLSDPDIGDVGFDEGEIAALDEKIGAIDVGDGQNESAADDAATITLAERFGCPPFSVLDARQGYWQDRKRGWLALGIQSEIGRGGGGQGMNTHSPTITQNPDGTLNYGTPLGGASEDGITRRSNATARKVSPGGSPRPACDYKNRERGDGRGRALNG